MALTNAQVTALADSIAKGISDYNSNFITGLSAPVAAINAGVGGQGANATLGRVMAYASVPDLADELAMLSPANQVASNVSAWISGVQNLNSFYLQYFPLLNALDTQLGGLNAFLVAQSLQVNAFFANAFNYFVSLASPLGLRNAPNNLPTKLSPAVFFPYAAIDNMWSFTSSGATTFSANAVGANADTSASGGGVAQFFLYKSNAGAATGGATFTVSFTKADGSTGTATYTTSAGTPAASGSLAAGYAITNAIGKAITGVTGSGMAAGESYIIGQQLVRAPAY